MNPQLIAFSAGITLLSSVQVLQAESRTHLYGMDIEGIETSSDFNRRTINFNFGKNTSGSAGAGISASHHRIEEGNDRFRANEVKTRLGHHLNEVFYIEGGAGVNQLESTTDSRSKDLTTYQLGATAKFGHDNSIGISHDKNFAYRQQILTNQNGQILTAKTTTTNLKVRPAERIRLEGEAKHRDFSDGNSSQQYKVGAYYGISPGWPWIWAGVEAGKLDFERKDEGYWTPEKHRSIATTFSASYPITDNTNVNSSASISRSKTDDNDEASTGYYVSVGADTKLGSNSKLSASAHYIKSQQDSSDWNQSGANLGITFDHY